MSRIGRTPVEIPEKVTVQVGADQVVITGPKGELKVEMLKGVGVKVEDSQVIVTAKNQEAQTRAFQGLIRSLINNCTIGVSEGYKKTLKLVGTGYRVVAKGAGLELAVGYSHKIEVKPKEGVKLSLESNDTIFVEGIDKQAVGQLAAEIRGVRPPEPYKGKGIRYEGEHIIRKQGKTAA